MTNPRVVVNPFTKNESRMRRNTMDNKWVSDNSGHLQAGPGQTTQFTTQQFQYLSHTPTMSAYSEEISPKARRRSPPMPRIRTSSPPVSPMFPDRASRRDSPVSAIGPIDFSHSGQRRKSSDVTLFPYYPSAIKKPEPKSKQTWWKQGLNKSVTAPTANPGENMANDGQASTSLTDFYRTAKDIYQVGPKGEGQKVWKSYMQFRKEKHNHTEARQDMLTAQANERPQTAPQLPATAHSVHRALRPLPEQSHTGRPVSRSPFTRKDTSLSEGAFSSSSYEVPLSIDQSNQQVIDLNKPLPPVPRLDPAPRTRPMDLEEAFKLGIAAANAQHPANRPPITQRPSHSQHESKATHSPSTPWWKAVLTDKQTAKSSHAALKAKISHVRSLAAFSDGRTANVASECGGVGGMAAASSSFPGPYDYQHQNQNYNSAHTSQAASQVAVPNSTTKKQVNRPRPLNLTPQHRQKGKQKAAERTSDAQTTHWRDVFDGLASGSKGRKRKDSDASFGCQGIGEEEGWGDVWVRDAGPSMQGRR